MKLTVKFVKNVDKSGLYPDGADGFYLQVSRTGSKSYIFRYQRNGNRHDVGLGSIKNISLTEAREEARRMTKKLRLDPSYDPLEEKRLKRIESRKQIKTFAICMDEFITLKKVEWTNKKHAQQWVNTLTSYALPHIGDKDIRHIETTDIKQLLLPIWTEKTETANRVRNRIEQIINYSIAHGYRQGENPARWRGHLDKLLPSPNKIKKVKHHSALPYREINSFVEELRTHVCISAYALEFLILTGTRTTEIIKAKWDEIDFKEKLWTIPAERMKAKKLHEVPLNSRAIELLEYLHCHRMNDFIFVGQTKSGSLSTNAMDTLLHERMNRPDITVHGFRSTFRD